MNEQEQIAKIVLDKLSPENFSSSEFDNSAYIEICFNEKTEKTCGLHSIIYYFYTKKLAINFLEDVLSPGCASSIVGRLIFLKDESNANTETLQSKKKQKLIHKLLSSVSHEETP